MAATKGKAGLHNESRSGRDSGRTDAGSPTLSAGAASLTTLRTYTLDDLDTIATVGKQVLRDQIKTPFSHKYFIKCFYILQNTHVCPTPTKRLVCLIGYGISTFSSFQLPFWKWGSETSEAKVHNMSKLLSKTIKIIRSASLHISIIFTCISWMLNTQVYNSTTY